jgi:heptosyltransferase I
MVHNAPLRVLISRLSAIGDCIHTLPVACELKRVIPQCQIGWVVQGVAATMLEGHPAVDQVHKVNRGWMSSFQQSSRLRRELQAARYDLVLDVQSLTKSALAGWLSGARTRLGFARPLARELAPWIATELVETNQTHVVDKYLQILQPLGIGSPQVDFRVPHRPEQAATAARMLRELHLHGIPFAVMNPGAGWDSKLWPARRFGEVARSLSERRQIPTLVVWAGEREQQWADEIVKVSGGRAVMAPPTSLNELAEIFRQASFFVGSDTGPLHLAAAVSTPCVGMYGPTRPEVCGPYGAGHLALQQYYQDGSSRQRRGSDNSAMQAISTELVIAACEQMVESVLGARRRPA